MSSVKTFDARVGALGAADNQAVAEIVKASADVALVVDAAGVVRDLHLAADTPLEEAREWLGQPWVETVTPESRRKVEEMLREAADGAHASRRRQVNHAFASGLELPVAYTAVRLGTSGNLVAIGRDLRAVSALQQRLVEAQQAMERDYWRLRHVETRYRLLFQLSTEAVVIADAATRKIVDANPAAARVLGAAARELVGRPFAFGATPADRETVERHLEAARVRGDLEPVRVRGAAGGAYDVHATLLRQDAAPLYLLRLVPEASAAGEARAAGGSRVVRALQSSPDGFVVTDPQGRVLAANSAFLDLAEIPAEERAVGESLSRWIGRPGADLDVLLGVLREHGVARLFTTAFRGELGFVSEVEISGAAAGGEEPCYGFTVRDVGRRLASGPAGARDLTRAVEQLTQLVGKVSLRDLIRDTSDLVERHFIEAALELTGDNRSSAAEVLGVSRQSLYVKLRRYGYDLKER